jgi:hypothetical protein
MVDEARVVPALRRIDGHPSLTEVTVADVPSLLLDVAEHCASTSIPRAHAFPRIHPQEGPGPNLVQREHELSPRSTCSAQWAPPVATASARRPPPLSLPARPYTRRPCLLPSPCATWPASGTCQAHMCLARALRAPKWSPRIPPTSPGTASTFPCLYLLSSCPKCAPL